MVSMKDIAKKCGVSVATVSKALNGQKDIGEETRKRICAIADELGYKANFVARALKTNRSFNLGMLLMDEHHNGLHHEYFSTILEGFKAEAESHGYDITFINAHVGDEPNSYIKHIRYRGLDGVMVAYVDPNDPRIRELAASNIPMVTVEYTFEGHTSVMSDNLNGVNALVRYAYGKGHRKIAYIHGEDNATTEGRLAGFHKACRDLRLEISPEYIVPGAYQDPDLCEKATRQLLQLPVPPTCILFPDDFSFIGGHNALLEAGRVIPTLDFEKKRSISAMGYNGFSLAKMINLTTYSRNAALIGRTAAQRLIQRIEHPDEFQPEQIQICGKLVEGNTVEDINEK